LNFITYFSSIKISQTIIEKKGRINIPTGASVT